MKLSSLLAFLGMSFFSASAFASSHSIQIEEGTKVLAITAEEAMPRNCPHAIKLDREYVSEGVTKIDLDNSVGEYLERLMRDLDDSAKLAIRKVQMKWAMGPTCLSFGKGRGTIYLPVYEGQNSVRIELPEHLVLVKATQLR